jgi:site-specific recombinase XerD
MSPASHQSSPFFSSLFDYMSLRRYSKHTIKSYLYWIKYFILFHQKRHPETMGPFEVEQFLTHLAVMRKVSASTQKIALNALAFLYNKVLEQSLGDLGEFNRAKTPARLPVVLTRHEMTQILSRMTASCRNLQVCGCRMLCPANTAWPRARWAGNTCFLRQD